MKGLAAAIGIRRRQLDRLRLAIAGQQQLLAGLTAAAANLRQAREAERRTATLAAVSADAWFALASTRLAGLAGAAERTAADLDELCRTALDARARLTLLEDAEVNARAAERRRRERQVQAALDDRTACLWSRR